MSFGTILSDIFLFKERGIYHKKCVMRRQLFDRTSSIISGKVGRLPKLMFFFWARSSPWLIEIISNIQSEAFVFPTPFSIARDVFIYVQRCCAMCINIRIQFKWFRLTTCINLYWRMFKVFHYVCVLNGVSTEKMVECEWSYSTFVVYD